MLESYGELLPIHYTKGGVPGYYPPIKGNRPELVFNLYDPLNFFSRMSSEAKEAGLVKEINNGRLAMIGFAAAVGSYIFTGQIIPGIF